MEVTTPLARRSGSLDGIRGLAVLLVFLSHSAGRGLYPSESLQFQGIGHIGVYLFFVLSSWLLTSITLKECYAKLRICLRAYFLRRFFRIAPLYFVVVLGVYLVQSVGGSYSPKYLHIDGGASGLFRHLIFYQGDSVFWTIPCEVSFYLVLPFLVKLLVKYPVPTVSVLLLSIIGFSVWTTKLYYGTLEGPPFPKIVDIVHYSQFIEVFLIGVLGAWLNWRYARRIQWSPRVLRAVDGIVLVLTSCLLFYVAVITCHKFLWFDRTLLLRSKKRK